MAAPLLALFARGVLGSTGRKGLFGGLLRDSSDAAKKARDNLEEFQRSAKRATSIRVEGTDSVYALSKAMKAAGQTEMRKELNKELQRAARPVIPRTRANALRTLPQRGGLAANVARAPQRVQDRTGKKTAGVRVVVGKRRGSAARAANDGLVRHPVFGTDKWVQQRVPPGWFDNAAMEAAPEARAACEAAMKKTVDDIVRKTKCSANGSL